MEQALASLVTAAAGNGAPTLTSSRYYGSTTLKEAMAQMA